MEEHILDPEIEGVISRLEQLAPNVDAIVVSDFVYGVVTPRILDVLYRLSQEYGVLFGDLQCSSQMGSITRFKNFSLLCPNEREARLALQRILD